MRISKKVLAGCAVGALDLMATLAAGVFAVSGSPEGLTAAVIPAIPAAANSPPGLVLTVGPIKSAAAPVEPQPEASEPVAKAALFAPAPIADDDIGIDQTERGITVLELVD